MSSTTTLTMLDHIQCSMLNCSACSVYPTENTICLNNEDQTWQEIINKHTTSHKVSASLSYFKQKWNILTNFSKNPKQKISHLNLQMNGQI